MPVRLAGMATPRRRRPPAPEDIDLAFGRVLRSLREDRGLSQEALGHECRSGRTFISELERGVKGASLKTLFRISVPLETEPGEIIKLVEAELRRNER
jgi:transcriptional regulator with XRE-family HTH domain